MAALCNFNGLASWKNAENSLQSVNLTMPARILKHVIRRIRHNWPRVEITLRGDGHYGTPEVMELLEDRGCGYIFGLPGNARLSKIGQPWCEDAAVRRVRQGKDRVRRFFQTGY